MDAKGMGSRRCSEMHPQHADMRRPLARDTHVWGSFGIMAEMLTRIYHESGGRTTYVIRETACTVGAQRGEAANSRAIKKVG